MTKLGTVHLDSTGVLVYAGSGDKSNTLTGLLLQQKKDVKAGLYDEAIANEGGK